MTQGETGPRRAAAALRWRRRLGRWLRRYAAAEICGTATAVAGTWAACGLGWGAVAVAYAGAAAENVGFYGCMLTRQWRRAPTPQARRRALGALLLELGPAELLDSLALRPLALGLAERWLGPGLGALVGKLAGDLLFYAMAIAAYETLRRRRRP